MKKNHTPSAGMGAIVGSEGVSFRVWAPNAQKVFVMGSFNDWNEKEHEFQHEENGYWAILVTEAKVSDEYKYVIINGDKKLIRNDPYAKKMTHSNGNSVVYKPENNWEDQGFQIVDWNRMVIYEMHIGTFSREGLGEGEVGNFYTAAKRLNYLKALGINAIEIMPVSEFAGSVSWGYNPSYPFAIETDYGGPEGLLFFVNEAHKLGIAVIMDVVYNHFGTDENDLWQFDGWNENEKGGIYFYNNHLSKTPWGDTRPDYGRKEVLQYLRDNAIMWLEEFHCDGLRFDGTSYIRYLEGGNLRERVELEEGYRFLQSLTGEIRSKHPTKILIAEDVRAESIVTSDIEHNGLGFHSQWGVGFAHIFKRVLIETEDSHRNLQEVVEGIMKIFNNDAFQRVIFTESHDEVSNGFSRLPEEIHPGQADSEYAKKKSTLGAIALMTAPGIPMLFQGQEFLMDKSFNDEEELDWDRFSDFKGITKLYRDLIKLRNGSNKEAIGLTGNLIEMLHFNYENLVIAYQRSHYEHQDKPCLIVLNFSNHEKKGYRIGVPFDGVLRLQFNSGWKGYDEYFTGTEAFDLRIENYSYEGHAFSCMVDLPQYGGIIWTKCH